MRFTVLDVETTGIPSEEDPHAVIEVGWCVIDDHGGGEVVIGEPQSMLVDPKRKIDIEAKAVHHITEEMLKGSPPPEVGFRHATETAPDVWVAHNADFERQFFGGGDKPWLCTFKAACRVFPDAPSFSNQVLRYWLDVNLDAGLAEPTHRAGPDAYVTAHLLAELLRSGTPVDEMIRWSKGPALLPRIMFGKHRGQKWNAVPTDYLRWIADKSDMDKDVKANARHWIKQRSA